MKKIVPVALIIIMCLAGASVPAVSGEEIISVVDARGVEVTLDGPPQRIVSYMASNTEMLFYMGLGDRVVGVDDYSNYPPEADELPKVGDLQPDIEHILYLEPDLVVATTVNTGLIEAMITHDIPVFVTGASSYQDIFEDMRMLGEICGIPETADLMVAQLEEDLDELTKDTIDIPYEERPSALFITGTFQGMNAVGNNTFIHTLMERAGLANIAGDKDGWVTYSEEEVISLDPDVLITTHNIRSTLEEFLEKESWGSITAVELEQVYYVEDDLMMRPGPRVIRAQETLVEIAEEIEQEERQGEDTPANSVISLLVTTALLALLFKKRKKRR